MPPRSVSSTLAKSVGGQPQPRQVTAPRRVVVVGVGLAGMQDSGVVQQLDVPGLELHLQVERGVVGDPLQHLRRFELLGGQPRRPPMSKITGRLKNGSSPGDALG
jgi:hypothetical protein